MYSVYCTMYILQYVQSIMYIVQCTLYDVYRIMNKDKLPHQFKLPIWRDKTNASFCFKFTELHTLMKSTIVNSNTLVSPRNKIQLATPLNSKIQSHIICYHYIYIIYVIMCKYNTIY